MNYASRCLVALLIYAPLALAGGRPDSHAPIGVMADHMHKKGELMLSYRYMHMNMAGNRDGREDLTPTEIATSEPNRFFGLPGQPPTLRVVPTKMTMDMHMLGAMYAPSDNITLMAMLNYVDKEMEHVTFQGPAGTTELGRFTTTTSGLGDTSLSALIRVTDGLHGIVGLSLPTGDLKETDRILTPMGGRPSPRLPYPMQLGSGTYDLITGLSYMHFGEGWSFGSQWRSTWRLGENDEDYTLGNEHTLTAWASWVLAPAASVSARLAGFQRGNIDGQDPAIAAPVQTADPDRQRVRRVDLAAGINLGGIPWSGHRLALEFSIPVYQDLSGPQLETDWQITAGYQWAF